VDPGLHSNLQVPANYQATSVINSVQLAGGLYAC